MDPVTAALNLPDLTDAESAELAAAAQAGDIESRDKLILHHLRLAKHMAKAFSQKHSEHFEDFFQVASMTLISCVARFEPERGVPFRTWAAQQLRFYIWKSSFKECKIRSRLVDPYRLARLRDLTGCRFGGTEIEDMSYDEILELLLLNYNESNPNDEIYLGLVDLCVAAEKRGLIERRHSETLLMRARGLPDKQITELLGIHRSTIRQRLVRTMDALREVCDDDTC